MISDPWSIYAAVTDGKHGVFEMVETSLVDSKIEDGRRLLDELKRNDAGFSRPRFLIGPAFWLYRPESLNWRLFIATPTCRSAWPCQCVQRRTGCAPLSREGLCPYRCRISLS